MGNSICGSRDSCVSTADSSGRAARSKVRAATLASSASGKLLLKDTGGVCGGRTAAPDGEDVRTGTIRLHSTYQSVKIIICIIIFF